MFRSIIAGLALAAGIALFAPAQPAQAQVYYRDGATGQWLYDAKPYRPDKAKRKRIASGPVDVYRNCRRQVRRSVGYVPHTRMRLPRNYHQMIDYCIANGGVYS